MNEDESLARSKTTERSRYRRLVLAMCAAQLLMGIGIGTYPALLPSLVSVWTLTATQAGVVGGVLFLGYVVATPFLSTLTDRIDARRIYLTSSAVAVTSLLGFAVLAD